jgi:hypothetical protein
MVDIRGKENDMETFIKLTDEEIIRTLECCSGEHCVVDCPLRKVDDCEGILCRNALDLINRLKGGAR